MKAMHDDSHLSDQQLLLDLDNELPPQARKHVSAHLGECWKCRARRQQLDRAIVEFARGHDGALGAELPPAAGQRALLKARLAQLSEPHSSHPADWFALRRGFAWALTAGAMTLACLGIFVMRSNGRQSQLRQRVIISVPDSRLTPGAALLASRQAVCTEANTKNKTVPVALQRKVFDAYGIRSAGLGDYEVDYLITPALGGADDIHNLWPQSYSATVWNAEVKDALEDRLRELVCDGTLDLREAQQEIAGNWIAAYKKYFHSEQPLDEHYKRMQ